MLKRFHTTHRIDDSVSNLQGFQCKPFVALIIRPGIVTEECWVVSDLNLLFFYGGYRKVEQIAEEADSLKDSLEKYFSRNQRRMLEAKERAELLGRANGESSHVLRIFDDEAQAFQSARNSSKMLEEAYSTGVAILGKFSEQRESMKSAHRKLLDVLNTVGLSNSVLRLIERRNRVDTWIKYAGMILTFIVLIVLWRWKH
ncbi:hypothetical protein RND81_12G237300 [Saponaria officinalis]|uniref:Membrin n=1 Tax=Saponaria officinalis TaxID=3572 RepID=A0AAW1HEM6_SAPOF